MCGICGVAGEGVASGTGLVRRMCEALVHRGPDDEGSVHQDGVTLGMRRLSIIDLEGGHQPRDGRRPAYRRRSCSSRNLRHLPRYAERGKSLFPNALEYRYW